MNKIRQFYQRLSKVVDGSKTTQTDSELATATQTSVRTTQRYLRHLRDNGFITIENNRYHRPGWGWCNQRTIHFGGI